MEIEEFIAFSDRIRAYYYRELGISVSDFEIVNALYILLSDKERYEWIGDLYGTEIAFEEAVSLLKNFNFDTLKHEIETEEDVIPETYLFKRKVRIKSKGLIWIIHRYDQDPFPSNPHAHQLESNIKLDLSFGKCFRLKEHVYTINKKDLLDIRTKAIEVYKGELPPLNV